MAVRSIKSWWQFLIIIWFSLFGGFLVPVYARADSLTTDQLQALSQWANWVGRNGEGCSVGRSIASTLPDAVPEPHRTLFTQAAAAFKTNPQFLAALFLTENGNVWKPFNTGWPTSPVGAS